MQAGKALTLSLSDGSAREAMKINFTYYQEVDGNFNVPTGTVEQSVIISLLK